MVLTEEQQLPARVSCYDVELPLMLVLVSMAAEQEVLATVQKASMMRPVVPMVEQGGRRDTSALPAWYECGGRTR